MVEEHPWDSYAKDVVWSGLAYPIGRDAVEQALVAAGAHLGALYFSTPKRNPPNDPPIVVRVHRAAEGRAGYFDSADTAANAPWLIMWIDAVPTRDRQAVRGALTGGWLDRACQWAAQVGSQVDRAVSLSEQELYLTWDGTAIVESPTWPPKGR